MESLGVAHLLFDLLHGRHLLAFEDLLCCLLSHQGSTGSSCMWQHEACPADILIRDDLAEALG